MGTALIARAITAVLVIAPWFVWLPAVGSSMAVVAFGVIALVAAFHGWGRLVARVGSCEVGVTLAIWWGIAATVALAGIMIALHIYEPRFLVIAGGVVHGLELSLAFRVTSDAIAGQLRWERLRFWLLPAALLAVLTVVHVMGAAGMVGNRPFDDDGHVIAQARRVIDTGALADPIGYAREAQLGGHVALGALVGAFADPSMLRLVDQGLAFVLLLALVVAHVRPRDAFSTIWSCLLLTCASAIAVHWTELAPLWLASGAIVAMYLTRDAIPLGLVAGAAYAIRSELIVVAFVLAAGVWLHGRRTWREAATVLGAAALGAGGYAIASVAAWTSVDGPAARLLEASSGRILGEVGIFVGIVLAALPLAWLTVREIESSRLRWLAAAVVIGMASIASGLIGVRPFSIHYVWPVVIGGLFALTIDIADRDRPPWLALVLAAGACMLVVEAGKAPGRSGWWPRYRELVVNTAYLRGGVAQPPSYDAIFARIPSGDTVAIWVSRPETVDYRQHRIVDLRTPRAAHLRVTDSDDHRLGQLVAASRARWLVIEADNAFAQRANKSLVYDLLCSRMYVSCPDSLETMAFQHEVVARDGDLELIRL